MFFSRLQGHKLIQLKYEVQLPGQNLCPAAAHQSPVHVIIIIDAGIEQYNARNLNKHEKQSRHLYNKEENRGTPKKQ